MTPRRRPWTLPALLLAAVLPAPAARAQDVATLYTVQQVQAIGATYAPNLRRVWSDDFIAKLSPAERKAAAGLRLELPPFGRSRAPLEFYSVPSEGRVVLPLASVKFLDDIAVAHAYYEHAGCDIGAVSDYAAALRFSRRAPAGSPLAALGVPPSALTDAYVDKVAMNALKSTVFFVMAHEFGHLLHRHRPYAELDAAQAQQQEAQADDFALDVMRRIGVPPVALGFFFLVASRLEPSPGDFDTPAQFEAYVQGTTTHPLSAARLTNVADRLAGNAPAFARLEPNATEVAAQLKHIAGSLRTIADGLDDRRMRRFLAERAAAIHPQTLATGCRP